MIKSYKLICDGCSKYNTPMLGDTLIYNNTKIICGHPQKVMNINITSEQADKLMMTRMVLIEKTYKTR